MNLVCWLDAQSYWLDDNQGNVWFAYELHSCCYPKIFKRHLFPPPTHMHTHSHTHSHTEKKNHTKKGMRLGTIQYSMCD